MHTMFTDRRDAGARLAQRLQTFAGRSDLLVLGLPRGGIPVAYEVARALGAPLDAFVVRKLGVPGHEELAMGAIASGGIRIVNEDLIRRLGISQEDVERVTSAELRELERRETKYRGTRPPLAVVGRTVVLVDDGLATGASMVAAVTALRRQYPSTIIVAVPVAARETCEALRLVADVCVCVETPRPFHGVGMWYQDFTQTTDSEVHELLDDAARHDTAAVAHR
jgi:predicted phosphoribosyltransferase